MNAANEHDKIRSLLSLAASGALDSADELNVENHVWNCPECAAQLAEWRALAGGLQAFAHSPAFAIRLAANRGDGS